MGKGITKEPVLACRRRCSSRAVEGQGWTWAEIPNRILSWAISIESIVNIPIFACEIVWDERPRIHRQTAQSLRACERLNSSIDFDGRSVMHPVSDQSTVPCE